MTDETQEMEETQEPAYKGQWWVEDLTEEEKKLFPRKYYDQLPGATLPEGIIVEENVPVEMGDGLKLAANVFRPDKDGEFPVILTFTPFSKDFYGQHAALGVSERTAFEAPDPGFWVPNDYVVILFDQRGTGRSPSGGTGGAHDYRDGVEWAGTQEWSNGKVGMLGHSALAMCQWEVASLPEPPTHLEAIIPWGALTDDKRDAFRPGGVPETSFGADRGENLPLWQEDFVPEEREPFPSVFSTEQGGTDASPELENINLPMLVGSTWADTEFHLRGNLRAWRRTSTPLENKWLYTYGGRKWKGIYTPPEAREMQLKFFEQFLKGKESGIMDVPRVRIEVRDTLFDSSIRYENDWPIPRTEYTKLYLDGTDDSLKHSEPNKESNVQYESESPDGKAVFDITFDSDTELTGHSMLKLWVSPEDARDMDIFVALRKLNENGDEVRFKSEAAPGRYPADQGWLRLSKRELDEERSQPWLPVQKSVDEGEPQQKVQPGDIVPAHIQLVGSSTVFKKGETLRLEISGDQRIENNLLKSYNDSANEGTHSIYTGGEKKSYLQIPVIPDAESYSTFALEPRKAVEKR